MPNAELAQIEVIRVSAFSIRHSAFGIDK